MEIFSLDQNRVIINSNVFIGTPSATSTNLTAFSSISNQYKIIEYKNNKK